MTATGPTYDINKVTFRAINGRPILWYEPKSNVTHACEGCYISPPTDMTRLIWTLCRIDVPANAAAAPPEFVEITCPECLAADSTEAEQPFSQARHDMDEINFKRERGQ